nr:hypothetical protein BAR15_180211 [Bartonella sp. AR 15-3]
MPNSKTLLFKRKALKPILKNFIYLLAHNLREKKQIICFEEKRI